MHVRLDDRRHRVPLSHVPGAVLAHELLGAGDTCAAHAFAC